MLSDIVDSVVVVKDSKQIVVPGDNDLTLFLAWAAVLGACLTLGSFAVPMKFKSVTRAKVHPLVFQTYKTFWVFMTSHLMLLFVPFKVSPWGILSGCLWVPSGVAACYAVQTVGITLATAIWKVTMIFNSFIWGVFILRDTYFHSWQMAILFAVALTVGIVGMTVAFSLKEAQEPNQKIFNDIANDTSSQNKAKVWGIAAALSVGIVGGTMLVPSKCAPYHGIHFVISFAYGAMVANAIYLGCYAIVCASVKKPLPSPHLRVMALPGFISGTAWSLGNVFSLHAVDMLGQGVGFSGVQCAVVVSGLWGIFFYHELSGKAIMIWLLFLLVCLVGIFGLATEKLSKAEVQLLLAGNQTPAI